MSKRWLILVSLILPLTFWGCNRGGPDKQAEPAAPPAVRGNVEEIARDVSAEVGTVSRSGQGAQGAPILVLEERHDSRLGQIEHAIVLTRLYEKHNLRHIGLEGLLQEEGAIKGAEMGGLSTGRDPVARAQVAAQFLRVGEIGGSEFLKMVYPDVVLHPVEKREERGNLTSDRAALITRIYLVRIAEKSLSEEQQQEYERLLDVSTKAAVEYVLSADPWTKSKADALDAVPPLEKEVALAKEIADRATADALDIPEDEQTAMANHLSFLRKRLAADKTMVDAVAAVADRSEAAVVAINIGQGHTKTVCDLLEAARRPFAVITPRSLKEETATGNLPSALLRRKYARLPLHPDGRATNLLLTAFPQQFKPPPVIREEIFKAKAELYDKTDQIVNLLFGPPGGPPPEPPIGPGTTFDDGDGDDDFHFKGELVWVDDEEKPVVIVDPETGRREVLFRATLNPNGASPVTVWVKAGRSEAVIPESQNVEEILKKTWEKVKTAPDGEVTKAITREVARADRKVGRVQVSIATQAIIATSKKDAVSQSLRY